MPQFPGHWAAPDECIKCDYEQYDMRKRRLLVVKRYGWRFGTGASRKHLGVDLFCCGMM